VNVLVVGGDEVLSQIQLAAGPIDAKMVVPRGGVGEIETDNIGYLSIAADAPIPVGQNVIVTLRLTQV
jgi:hypothetical protein